MRCGVCNTINNPDPNPTRPISPKKNSYSSRSVNNSHNAPSTYYLPETKVPTKKRDEQSEQNGDTNPKPNPIPILIRCVVCQLKVTGMTSFCYQCGHGGHIEHMYNWFLEHDECPTGCGCICGNAHADTDTTQDNQTTDSFDFEFDRNYNRNRSELTLSPPTQPTNTNSNTNINTTSIKNNVYNGNSDYTLKHSDSYSDGDDDIDEDFGRFRAPSATWS